MSKGRGDVKNNSKGKECDRGKRKFRNSGHLVKGLLR